MALDVGEEFKAAAVPGPELQRKLLYLARIDSGSVLTPKLVDGAGGIGESASKDDSDLDLMWSQYLQAIEEQTARLAARIELLEQASRESLQEAEERLEEIRRNANRAIDGRIVFEDENGKIRDEHGGVVAEEEIDRDRWRDSADKWEDFQKAQEDLDSASKLRQDVRNARDDLENDPSGEDLDALEERIGALEEAAGLSNAAPEGQHEADQEPRSTSAVKLYENDQPGSTAALNSLFSDAVDPARPQQAPEEPATTPCPDVPFQPN